MRERQGWLDAARGLALSLVVLLHTVAWLRAFGFTVSPWLLRADQILDGFRMPTLVLISGMLATTVRTWPWPEVLRRRIAPLMLLYIAWAPITVLAIDWLKDGEVSLTGDGLADLILRPEPRLWYFYALALYMAGARLLRTVPTAPLIAAAVVVNLASSQWLEGAHLSHGLESWAYVLQHWVFFVAAERLAARYSAVIERRSLRSGLAWFAAFWLAGAALVALGVVEQPVATLALGVLGTAVTLTLLPVIGEHRLMAWSRAVGRRSLGVYALHAVTAAGVASVVGEALPHARGAGLILPVVIAAIVVAVTCAVTIILDRWAPVPLVRPWWSTKARERQAVPSPAE